MNDRNFATEEGGRSMSRRHWCRVIDDINSQNMDQQTVQVLTDLFENLMGSITVTSARMARFDLGDFYSARALGVTDYELIMERMTDVENSWIGRFRHKHDPASVLTILGHLERSSKSKLDKPQTRVKL